MDTPGNVPNCQKTPEPNAVVVGGAGDKALPSKNVGKCAAKETVSASGVVEVVPTESPVSPDNGTVEKESSVASGAKYKRKRRRNSKTPISDCLKQFSVTINGPYIGFSLRKMKEAEGSRQDGEVQVLSAVTASPSAYDPSKMSKKETLSCTFCPYWCEVETRMILHLFEHRNFTNTLAISEQKGFLFEGDQYLCRSCVFKSSSRLMFREHIRCHTIVHPYSCGECSIPVDLKLVREHFREKHGNYRPSIRVTPCVDVDSIMQKLGSTAPHSVTEFHVLLTDLNLTAVAPEPSSQRDQADKPHSTGADSVITTGEPCPKRGKETNAQVLQRLVAQCRYGDREFVCGVCRFRTPDGALIRKHILSDIERLKCNCASCKRGKIHECAVFTAAVSKLQEGLLIACDTIQLADVTAGPDVASCTTPKLLEGILNYGGINVPLSGITEPVRSNVAFCKAPEPGLNMKGVAAIKAVPATTKAVPATTKAVPATIKAVPATTDAVPATTKAVHATTKAVHTTTKAVPATTKAVPATTKAVPATIKAAPATTKAVPATTKDVPATTKAVPATTKDVPATTKAVHVTIKAVPATTTAVPATTKDVPATTKAVPVTIKAAPATTKAVPATIKAVPATTNAVPATTKAVPATIKAVSATTKDVPATVKAVPATTKAVPATTKAVPVITKAAPATTKAVPATIKAVPATTKAVPATIKVVPATVKAVPATTKAVPATIKYVPATTKDVPATIKYVPATTKDVPATIKDVPATVKDVPVTTKAVPTTIKAVPATTKAVPATTKDVPATIKAVPITIKAVPATTKAVPATIKAVLATIKAVPATTKAVPTTTKAVTALHHLDKITSPTALPGKRVFSETNNVASAPTTVGAPLFDEAKKRKLSKDNASNRVLVETSSKKPTAGNENEPVMKEAGLMRPTKSKPSSKSCHRRKMRKQIVRLLVDYYGNKYVCKSCGIDESSEDLFRKHIWQDVHSNGRCSHTGSTHGPGMDNADGCPHINKLMQTLFLKKQASNGKGNWQQIVAAKIAAGVVFPAPGSQTEALITAGKYGRDQVVAAKARTTERIVGKDQATCGTTDRTVGKDQAMSGITDRAVGKDQATSGTKERTVVSDQATSGITDRTVGTDLGASGTTTPKQTVAPKSTTAEDQTASATEKRTVGEDRTMHRGAGENRTTFVAAEVQAMNGTASSSAAEDQATTRTASSSAADDQATTRTASSSAAEDQAMNGTASSSAAEDQATNGTASSSAAKDHTITRPVCRITAEDHTATGAARSSAPEDNNTTGLAFSSAAEGQAITEQKTTGSRPATGHSKLMRAAARAAMSKFDDNAKTSGETSSDDSSDEDYSCGEASGGDTNVVDGSDDESNDRSSDESSTSSDDDFSLGYSSGSNDTSDEDDSVSDSSIPEGSSKSGKRLRSAASTSKQLSKAAAREPTDSGESCLASEVESATGDLEGSTDPAPPEINDEENYDTATPMSSRKSSTSATSESSTNSAATGTSEDTPTTEQSDMKKGASDRTIAEGASNSSKSNPDVDKGTLARAECEGSADSVTSSVVAEQLDHSVPDVNKKPVADLPASQAYNASVMQSSNTTGQTSYCGSVSKQTASQDNAPKQIASQDNAPKQTASSDNAPKQSASSSNAPKQTSSQGNTPKQTTSSGNAPKQTASHGNASMQTTSSSNSCKRTASQENAPKHTTSSGSAPKQTPSQDNAFKQAASPVNAPKQMATSCYATMQSASQDKAPKQTTSSGNAPKQPASQGNSPNQTTSSGNATKQTASSGTTPKQTTSQGNASKQTTSSGNASKQTATSDVIAGSETSGQTNTSNKQSSGPTSLQLVARPKRGRPPKCLENETTSVNNTVQMQSKAVLKGTTDTQSIDHDKGSAKTMGLVAKSKAKSGDKGTKHDSEAESETEEEGDFFKCRLPTCGQSFPDVAGLRKHLEKSHRSTQLFPCPYCSCLWSNYNRLIEHIPSHVGPKPYRCVQCNVSYRKDASLRRHFKKSHHVAKNFACTVEDCEFVTNLWTEFKVHVFSYHPGEKGWTCFACDARFPKREDYFVHVESGMESVICCGLCMLKAKMRHTITRHSGSVHSGATNPVFVETTVKCVKTVEQTQPTGTPTKPSAVAPMKSVVLHECRHCDYADRNKASFDKHEESHGIQKKLQLAFCCELCPFGSSDGTQYKVHLANHLKTPVHELRCFKCTHCTFATNQMKMIEKHLQEMHKERPFKFEVQQEVVKTNKQSISTNSGVQQSDSRATPQASDKLKESGKTPKIKSSGKAAKQTTSTGNTPKYGSSSGNVAKQTASSSNAAKQTTSTDNAAKQTASSGNTPKQTASTGNSAKQTASSGNTPKQIASSGKTPKQTASTGNTAKQASSSIKALKLTASSDTAREKDVISSPVPNTVQAIAKRRGKTNRSSSDDVDGTGDCPVEKKSKITKKPELENPATTDIRRRTSESDTLRRKSRGTRTTSVDSIVCVSSEADETGDDEEPPAPAVSAVESSSAAVESSSAAVESSSAAVESSSAAVESSSAAVGRFHCEQDACQFKCYDWQVFHDHVKSLHGNCTQWSNIGLTITSTASGKDEQVNTDDTVSGKDNSARTSDSKDDAMTAAEGESAMNADPMNDNDEPMNEDKPASPADENTNSILDDDTVDGKTACVQPQTFHCDFCTTVCEEFESFKSHMEAEHSYHVVKTDDAYPVQNILALPIESPSSDSTEAVGSDLLQCKNCPFTSKSRDNLAAHKLKHSSMLKTGFKCMYCSYSASQRFVVTRHARLYHPDRPRGIGPSHVVALQSRKMPTICLKTNKSLSKTSQENAVSDGQVGGTLGMADQESGGDPEEIMFESDRDNNSDDEASDIDQTSTDNGQTTDTFMEIKKTPMLSTTVLNVKPETASNDPLNVPRREPHVKFYKCIYCDFCSEDRFDDIRDHIFVAHLRRNHFNCVYCEFGSMMKSDVISHCLKDHPGKDKTLSEDREYSRNVSVLDTHGDELLVGMTSKDNVSLIKLPRSTQKATPSPEEPNVTLQAAGNTVSPGVKPVNSVLVRTSKKRCTKGVRGTRTCKECGFTSATYRVVAYHVIRCHLPAFACPYCSLEIDGYKSFLTHTKASHPLINKFHVQFITSQNQRLILPHVMNPADSKQQNVLDAEPSASPKHQTPLKKTETTSTSSVLDYQKHPQSGTRDGNCSTTGDDESDDATSNHFNCFHCDFGRMTKSDVISHCVKDHPGKDKKVREDREYSRSVSVLETHRDELLVGMTSKDNVPLMELPRSFLEEKPYLDESHVPDAPEVTQHASDNTASPGVNAINSVVVRTSKKRSTKKQSYTNHGTRTCKECGFSSVTHRGVAYHVIRCHLPSFACPYCSLEIDGYKSFSKHVKASHPLIKKNHIQFITTKNQKLISPHVTNPADSKQQSVLDAEPSASPKPQTPQKIQGDTSTSSVLDFQKKPQSGTHDDGDRSATGDDESDDAVSTCSDSKSTKSHSFTESNDAPSSGFLWKCTTCGTKLAMLEAMRIHVLTQHMTLEPFQCAVCDFGDGSTDLVEAHIRETHQHSRIHIPVVDVVSEKVDSLKKKMIRVRAKKAPVSTDATNSETFDYSELCSIGTSGVSVYVCDLCDHKVESNSEMVSHRLSHALFCSYDCGYCDHKSDSMYLVQKHTNNVHPGRSLKYGFSEKSPDDICDEVENATTVAESIVPSSAGQCTATTKTSSSKPADASEVTTPVVNRTSAAATTPNKEKLACNTNSEVISSSDDGVSSDDDLAPMYECRKCGETNPLERVIQHHVMLDHLKYRPYKCNYCRYSHVCRRSVRNHIAKSHAGRPSCIVYEPKKKLDVLVKENVIQATKVSTTDDANGPTQNNTVETNEPKLDDTNEPKEDNRDAPRHYTCVRCKDYMTTSKVYMLRHLAREIGYFPFECPHCSHSANRQDNVKTHIRLNHPGLEVETRFNKDDAKESEMVELLERCTVVCGVPAATSVEELCGVASVCILGHKRKSSLESSPTMQKRKP